MKEEKEKEILKKIEELATQIEHLRTELIGSRFLDHKAN